MSKQITWLCTHDNQANFIVGGTLSLIGHSAGGWLARVYMEEFGLSHISLLLTLGTPHLYVSSYLPVLLPFSFWSPYKCSSVLFNALWLVVFARISLLSLRACLSRRCFSFQATSKRFIWCYWSNKGPPELWLSKIAQKLSILRNWDMYV